MNIGNKIRSYRKKKGLTKKQLGSLINKSEISIRKYEAGDTNIPLEVLCSIANVLDIDALELIGMHSDNSDYLDLFKKYMDSKGFFTTDNEFISEIEKHISEYINFKINNKK